MKRMLISVLSVFIIVAWLSSLSGCDESAQDKRKARLVANQNLELKNLLKLRDEQIATLEKELEKCRKERADFELQSGETARKMLELLSETTKELEQLRQENEKLKQQLSELQEKLSQQTN